MRDKMHITGDKMHFTGDKMQFMRDKIRFIGLVVLLGAVMLPGRQVQAAPVSREKARQVATMFLNANGLEKGAALTDVSDECPFSEFYVFTFDTGFVMVSGNDLVPPILGYSMHEPFVTKDMPENVRGWFGEYEAQLRFVVSRGGQPSPETAALWRNPAGGGKYPSSHVEQLMDTKWNQKKYYNTHCPDGSMTGCVATATAQIMKYWNYPATGSGSHCYESRNYGTLCADFEATSYDWGNMPDYLTATSTEVQIDAVATLMYHVGVSVEMNYAREASSAFIEDWDNGSTSAEVALKKYFKYNPMLHSIMRENYTYKQWCDILREELYHRCPVLYRGEGPDGSGGHAFVVDGYDTCDMFHFNWGWGGAFNGYYKMGVLQMPIGDDNFSYDNVAVIGIRPNASYGTDHELVIYVNDTSLGRVSGGGHYAFNSPVSLTATANSGCRFVMWSDGDRHNSRALFATGGNDTLTAYFEWLGGDTVTYCTCGFVSSLGYGSNTACTWGIKLPPQAFGAGEDVHDMYGVQVFLVQAGTYQLTIRQGLNSPGEVLQSASITIDTSGEKQWHYIELPSPITPDSVNSLWAMITSSGVRYPAAYTFYSGNKDGMLWDDYTPVSDRRLTWMIRAILAAPPEISIAGMTEATQHRAATFFATTTGGTVEWEFEGGNPSVAYGNTVRASWQDTGVYRVVATVTNAAGTASDTMQIHILPSEWHPTGIEEISASDVQFEIIPNPATGRVQIALEETQGRATVRVMDVRGVSLMEALGSSFVIEGLPRGVYLVRVETEAGGVKVKRLVVR